LNGIMRPVTVAALFTLGVVAWGCSAADYGGGTTGGPAGPTPPGTVTITVVGIDGAMSFSPNPATVPAGQMVVWHNVDGTSHRVVLNDRSVDTGLLAPGASSRPVAIGPAGPYHCSIHPEMVGTVVQDAGTPASTPH
jgi:plastocyanin